LSLGWRCGWQGAEAEGQVVAPTTGAVAVAGDRNSNSQSAGDYGGNHNHIHTEEVINDNDEHPGVP